MYALNIPPILYKLVNFGKFSNQFHTLLNKMGFHKISEWRVRLATLTIAVFTTSGEHCRRRALAGGKQAFEDLN